MLVNYKCCVCTHTERKRFYYTNVNVYGLCVCVCPHLRHSSNRKSHLQVVKSGCSDGVKPVHNFLPENTIRESCYVCFYIVIYKQILMHSLSCI